MKNDWIVRWDRLVLFVLFLVIVAGVNRCSWSVANIIVPHTEQR